VATNLNPVTLGNFKNGFSSVIDPALPSVVNISSTSIVTQQANTPGFLNDPFFRQFSDERRSRGWRPAGRRHSGGQSEAGS
jgi:S1-C subfamily serine protease